MENNKKNDKSEIVKKPEFKKEETPVYPSKSYELGEYRYKYDDGDSHIKVYFLQTDEFNFGYYVEVSVYDNKYRYEKAIKMLLNKLNS